MYGLTGEQKAARRSFIGGSDAGAIVAGGEAWRELWLEKTGRKPGPDLSDILAVMMGHATEPFNRFWFEKQTRRRVVRAGELQRHPTIPYLACNLDGATTAENGAPAAFQAKHVGKAGEHLTLRYTAQCTHEALCLGFDWWVMSTFIGNSKWELTEQQVDPFFAEDYLAKCEEFWGYVERDQEPPDAAPLPVPPPRKLRTVRLDDDDPQWPNWGGEVADSLDAWLRTNAAHKAHMAAQEMVKKLMPEDVGTILRGSIKAAKDRTGAVRISIPKEKPDAA